MAVERDISFYRGEDVTYTPSMDPVVDITGWTITFTVRINASDTDPAVITKTATITDGPNGIYTIAIEDADTTDLGVGLYAYDIKRMDAGAEGLLVRGALILQQEVTR